MNVKFLKSTFTLLLLLGCINAKAQDLSRRPDPILKTRTGIVRFSFENITMPSPGERMGLMGFNYLLNLSPYFYGGIAGYGAITGERGGFLTGGFEGGIHYPFLAQWMIEGGLFAGGGGGGGAAQGGGLMLRPHIGLIYDPGSYRLGIQYSEIKFPNGEINSGQAALSLDIPFTSLYADRLDTGQSFNTLDELTSGSSPEIKNNLGFATENIMLTFQSYFPSGQSLNTSGQPLTERISLIGIEFRHYFSEKVYFLLQPGGALGGNADGYAEIFFGTGVHYPLPFADRIALTGSLAAGSGGGGRVDTGGGTLLKANGGIEYRLSPRILAEIDMGYIGASGGSFSARTTAMKIGYEMESLTFGSTTAPVQPDDKIRLTGWRLRSSHQTYLNPQRKSPDTSQENVNLIGLKVDRVLSENFYLTGQAISAYNGHAGGYSGGLIGPGWESPFIFGTKSQLIAEILIGAGGGGGLSAGGGAIVQPVMGLNYRFTQNFSTQVMGGRVKSISGDLNSTIIDFSLVYHFAKLERE